jgi:hypothetical protein
MTSRCNDDKELRKETLESAIEAYRVLAEYAAEVGLPSLAYEMTSVDRETCATFAENDYVLERCGKFAVPMRVCLDLGHRNMKAGGDEACHLKWIERYAHACDVIDLQQTNTEASHHWPFTEAFNAKGVIDPQEVVDAITAASVEHDILLGFELRSSAYYPNDDRHLDTLKASVDYWRKYVTD